MGYPETPSNRGPFWAPFETPSGAVQRGDQAVLHPIVWSTAAETSRYPAIVTSGGALRYPQIHPHLGPYLGVQKGPKGVK